MLFHDLVVLWNEIADIMVSVNDEETATHVMATRAKSLKIKVATFKDRVRNQTNPPNGALNRTEKEDYNAARLDYVDDLAATSQRLIRVRDRLKALIDATKAKGSPTTNLEAVWGLPCGLPIGNNELAPGRIDAKSTSKQTTILKGEPAPCGLGGGGGGRGFGPGG
jgi:hypothetical protein